MKKCKIILVGDSNCGKSALVNRFQGNSFEYNQNSTIGVDFAIIYHNDCKAHLWDTAGQEQFHSIITSYYHDAEGLFIVYDVNKPFHNERIRFWIDDFFKHNAKNNVIIYIIGNKCDLYTHDGDPSVLRLDEFEKSYDNTIKYYLVSAKTDRSLTHIINAMIIKIQEVTIDVPFDNIRLDINKKKKIDCCSI